MTYEGDHEPTQVGPEVALKGMGFYEATYDICHSPRDLSFINFVLMMIPCYY